MSNPFRKVRPGEKIQVPAEAYNAFIDAALDYKRRKREEGGGPFQPPMGAILVKVKNESGSARQRFDVLAIEEPIVTPTDNLTEFQAEPAFRGVTPQAGEAEAPHRSRFAILWAPVPQDQIAAKACIAGITIARVNVTDEAHQFADVAHGICEYLESKPCGGAQILWKEPGTGVRWAIVRLGPLPSDLCRFQLSSDLPHCGRASAEKIIFANDVGWCDTSSAITIVDSLGIVPGSLPAGSMGWARWMPDSQQWELISYGQGCCGSSSSSSSSSTSDSSSSSSSSSSSESSTSSSSYSSTSSSSVSSSSSSSPPPSSSSSPPPPSSSGSEKSSAIVPVSWSKTGYVALFIHEMPEVRFDDVMVAKIPQEDGELTIDPKFVSVCERGSIEVCGWSCDKPVAIGLRVINGNKVRVQFASQDPKHAVRLVIRLTAIRKGFAGVRFPARTRKQFEANERFINSAYPSDPEAE